MTDDLRIKSVAIIGAGAAGAVTAAAFAAEKYFSKIKVFERRETTGGTWNYDPSPERLPLQPGGLPKDIDPPLRIPSKLPTITSPNQNERYLQTPVYSSLTTNVPHIAMSFSDSTFAYGPFVPHHIPRQYIEWYFSTHNTDSLISLNTTVEDLSAIPSRKPGLEAWNLILRKHDPIRKVDIWWSETFDAVILANGHYSVPFIPEVKGLSEYLDLFPTRIKHSKTYRTPEIYTSKRVLIIGNSASGHDLIADILPFATLPVYQSRRSPSRWDGPSSPEGIEWKPTIKEFLPSGRIVFTDGTWLDEIDTVIYCTGYKPSYPFWNVGDNGREFYDYKGNKLVKTYLHTFFQDFKTLAIVGMPRVLTFRSFEYQAIALARLFSGRNAKPLPPLEEQERWESERAKERREQGQKFHDIAWETGETLDWLGKLYEVAGLPRLTGEGRAPPVLGEEVRWAVEHLRKYPEPGKGKKDWKGNDGREKKDKKIQAMKGGEVAESINDGEDMNWVVVERRKDLMAFI